MEVGSVNSFTIGVAIWGGVVPIVSLFIGSYLVRSSQRRQWLADERVKEWRELLTTLTASFTAIIQSSANPKSVERLAEGNQARAVALEVLRNRLFIAEEVRRRKIFDSWNEAVNALDETKDVAAFGRKFGIDVSFPIEQAATKDISKV